MSKSVQGSASDHRPARDPGARADPLTGDTRQADRGDDDRDLRERIQALQARLAQSWPAKFGQRFVEYDILALAAALSFYTLVSLAPLILMLLWVTTMLYPSAQQAFFDQIGGLVGTQAEATARTIVENAQDRPGTGSMAALFGTVALLIGASVVFGQLQTALNRVFRSDAKRLGGIKVWLRKRLTSFGLVIGIGFLLVVSMAVQAALALLIAYVPDLLPALAAAISFLLYAAVFAAMYRLLPDRAVTGWRAALGGVLTAALFMFGRWAIGLYLGQADLGSAYGPAGGLVVLLVWMYYCAIIFFSGALITAMLDEHARVKRRLAAERSAAGL